MYSIKGLKRFVGMEGEGGFNVTLCRNGSPVAFVVNDDCGGDYLWKWKDDTEEVVLRNHCKTLPPVEIYGMKINVDIDMFISMLIETTKKGRKAK